VLLADALFVATAAAGLGAAIVASHPLFVAIRFSGIAYLTYFGVRALMSRRTEFGDATEGSPDRAFRLGLRTQLANPNVISFFASLLPQFVDSSRPVVLQFVILGATFVMGDAMVFAVYAALANQARPALP